MKKLVLKETLGRHVAMARKAFKRRLRLNLIRAGYDISAEQMIVLLNVSLQEGMNQQQIAELLDFDKTATTRLLDCLEKKDMAVRVPDKVDRRQKMIFLTKGGKQKCKELRQLIVTTHKQALKGIENEHVRICREVLRKVQENLCQE